MKLLYIIVIKYDIKRGSKLIKENNIKIIKVAASATISIIISTYLGLEFAVTSGIISILCIHNTRKEAILIEGRRALAAILAIALSFILYLVLGNSTIIFGLFLLLFIPLTELLKVEAGMSMGAVLSTHLLVSESISINWVLNEVLLTIVGISVAMIFNFFTISLEEDFEKNKKKIEEVYKVILLDMSESLLSHSVPIYEQKLFIELDELIKKTEYIATKITNNYIFKNYDYYITYINLRIIQLDIIKRMKRHFSRFNTTLQQTIILSDFTKNVAMNIFEYEDDNKLINDVNIIRKDYQSMELPRTREEFENRALLLQFLNDLEDLIMSKREFILSEK